MNITTKQFISISNYGSISVLGIPLGTPFEETKLSFKDYKTEDIVSGIVIKGIKHKDLPELDIIFVKDNKGLINEIRISNYHINKKELEIVFNHFKGEFYNLDYAENKDYEDENYLYKQIELSNSLHKILLRKCNSKNSNENNIFMICIIGKLLDCHSFYLKNDELSRYNSIVDIYLNNDKIKKQRIMDKDSKVFRADVIFKSIKLLILLFALFIAFLFALNGRYKSYDYDVHFDKWTKTILYIERFDEII